MGRKYPDGLAEIRQTEGSKTNETMATINENLKKQLAKKMYHFVKYFPVRIRNVGEDAIENRKLVWGFKDADREITLKVARMTASYLLNEFGDRVKNIVLYVFRQVHMNRTKIDTDFFVSRSAAWLEL